MSPALLERPVVVEPVLECQPEVPEVTELAIAREAGVGPYRQWNPSAVACYLRNANCDGCFYQTFFNNRNYGCHMADAVQHLLKRVGPPDKRRLEKAVV